MPYNVGPSLHSDVLTPVQLAFLRRFFAASAAPSFFLTGGTSLAGFYFGHRLSDDLDLFTLDDMALPEAEVVVNQIAESLNLQNARSRRFEYFRQFIFEPADAEGAALRIDLVRDFGPQYGERVAVEGIIVDSVQNIAANKVTAILGRTEAKDFVDLHFILKTGFEFDRLFQLAKEKDTGLTEFYLAQALLEVRRLTRLPIMRVPFDLSEMQSQFVNLANNLLDRINPQNHTFHSQ